MNQQPEPVQVFIELLYFLRKLAYEIVLKLRYECCKGAFTMLDFPCRCGGYAEHQI